MMLKTKIQEDLKRALKEKREVQISVLRMLISAIYNKEIEKRTNLWKKKPQLTERELERESQLSDEDILGVISSEIKKRKEAILLVRQSLGQGEEKEKRENFISKEEQELEVLEKYLPEQLSPEEIKKLAKEAIEKVGAKEIKDIGKVMAELMPKVKGKTEGGVVSKMVKELLASKE